jgi:hypothetical protein
MPQDACRAPPPTPGGQFLKGQWTSLGVSLRLSSLDQLGGLGWVVACYLTQILSALNGHWNLWGVGIFMLPCRAPSHRMGERVLEGDSTWASCP